MNHQIRGGPALSRFVDVSEGYLHVVQEGEGPDVVLLNAGLLDLRMWDTTAAWLTSTHRVTRWDFRDSGLSSPSSTGFSEIADLAAVLDATGVSQATLVGSSNGARQALAFAHAHPGRVRNVCVVGGSFGEFPDPTPDEEAARQIMVDMFRRREQALRTVGAHAAAAIDVDGWASAVGPDDRRRLIGWQAANCRLLTMDEYHGIELTPPVKARFAEIETPVSIVVGTADYAGTQLWARRLATQAPRATLHVLAGADHYPMFSTPAAFKSYLQQVL
jgi:pimeloyl-ACP methyl ester carboxylesterase